MSDQKIKYICTGTCGAQISQEQYDEGLTKCGADGCTMHNHPFKKVEDEESEEE